MSVTPTQATHQSIADELYGPLNWDPAQATGRNPFGVHGGADTRAVTPAERVEVIANTKGAHALLLPSGPLFWAIAGVGIFLILNASARA